MSKPIANRLRQWRVEQGLTLEEMSDLTGVSIGHLSRVERGLKNMAPLARVKVARCLGLRVADLFDVVEVPDGEA